MLVLPLIKRKKTLIFKIFYTGTFVTLLLGLVSIFFWSGNATLILLALLCVFSIPSQLMKTYDVVGTIKLTSDVIIVDDQQNQLAFQISNISRLKVHLLEVEGNFHFKSIMMKQGVDNYLSFISEGNKKEYMFLLKEETVPDLRSLFVLWRSIGIPFTLYNATWRSFS